GLERDDGLLLLFLLLFLGLPLVLGLRRILFLLRGGLGGRRRRRLGLLLDLWRRLGDRDLERLLARPDAVAHVLAEKLDERAILVDASDDPAPLGKRVVGAERCANPQNQRRVRVFCHYDRRRGSAPKCRLRSRLASRGGGLP